MKAKTKQAATFKFCRGLFGFAVKMKTMTQWPQRVLFFLLLFAFSIRASAQPQIVGTISQFDKPFLFAYGSWDKKVGIENKRALLKGATPRGGAGVNETLNLAAHPNASPALRLKTGAGNTMKKITLLLRDTAEITGEWQFELPAPGDNFSLVTPQDGAPLSQPNKISKAGAKLDLANIMQWQLIGDWSADTPLDVEIESIVLIAPDAALMQQRAALETQKNAELEKARREREALQAKYGNRNANSPQVKEVALVAPDIIALTIEAGRIIPSSLTPYQAQPDDKTQPDGQGVKLLRGGHEIGWLIGPKKAHRVTYEKFEGDPLLEFLADEKGTFAVHSKDDAAFANSAQPINIFRKSKPIDWAQPAQGFVMRHMVYLKMPRALTSGKHYTIATGALNVNPATMDFDFDATKTRSEAVHVHQIGYRPDDPIKRAFLSDWLGTGGALKYPDGLKFSLRDKNNKAVFTGALELAKSADEKELMWKDQNFNRTDVYRMDFGDFQTPGTYRVCVENIGCSYPFQIEEQAWQRAFKIQIQGLYNQRSGVEVGPPYSDFKKPRDFHPADGVRVFRSKYSALEKGGEAFKELAEGSTGELLPDAWGGYHDAGDWNPRRVTHLSVTMAQLELLELFPAYFSKLKLSIPITPDVPDILTEALFEIDCFRRLQNADGGVPHGIETPGDPIAGEVSWLQSMDAYVFAPDINATYIYAGVCARAAKLLAQYKPQMAPLYRDSALHAMQWAEKDYAQRKVAGTLDKLDWTIKDARNYAALILYDLTGEKQWHDVFLENTVLNAQPTNIFQWGKAVQRDAAFLYARLPANKTEATLKKNAVSAIENQASSALNYAKNNAFNLTTPDKGKPMFLGFYSTPDAIELARAHFLTGKKEYLAGAVQATQFQAGCNPNNMTYTTGLGTNPILHPLHLDSRHTGQKAPVGLTVYGNVDYYNWNQSWITWPIQYHLSKICTPSPDEWPVPEAYFDIFLFVAQNEFTVDAWTPNVYVWGYLAARP